MLNTAERAFNRQISAMIGKTPNSDATRLIGKVRKHYNSDNHYLNFDLLSDKVGVFFFASEIIGRRGGTIGFTPCFTFNPGNVFKEEPHTKDLVNRVSPLSYSKCYENLAKEFVYLLMRGPEIEEVFEK